MICESQTGSHCIAVFGQNFRVAKHSIIIAQICVPMFRTSLNRGKSSLNLDVPPPKTPPAKITVLDSGSDTDVDTKQAGQATKLKDEQQQGESQTPAGLVPCSA